MLQCLLFRFFTSVSLSNWLNGRALLEQRRMKLQYFESSHLVDKNVFITADWSCSWYCSVTGPGNEWRLLSFILYPLFWSPVSREVTGQSVILLSVSFHHPKGLKIFWKSLHVWGVNNWTLVTVYWTQFGHIHPNMPWFICYWAVEL